MNKTRFFRCGLVAAFLLLVLALGSVSAFAQDGTGAASEAPKAVWHYLGAAIGLGMIVIGASMGISKLAAAAGESIARQPSAAAQITSAVNLPLFLMEGVAILGEVFILLIVLQK